MDEDYLLDEDDQAPVLGASQDVVVALDEAAVDFDQELRILFPDQKDYKTLRTIGAFIMRGMSLRDSCVLSRISYERFEVLMQKYPPISDFITFKQAAYKASLLNTLASSATEGRKTKVAGYLLENHYRDEYGKKTKDDRTHAPDALESALEAVRMGGDSEPLVRRELPAPKP